MPVDKAGSYELELHLSKAEDYGIFSFRLDDGPASQATDLFHPKLQPPMIMKLKPKASEGEPLLRIPCHGKNPNSSNSLIGIDYLILKEGL